MSADIAIDARELGKQYRIGLKSRRHDTLRDSIIERTRSLLRSTESATQAFWALREATFQIRRGERVGVIGLNGAGKSTLLKILSRITAPTTGSVRIAGRVGALLEVGTGFHPELTGRENVYLYGAILGMSRSEVTRKFDAIVDFSGISNFIDTPVKRFSSGMYVRLAFAVAAHLEPEILLLDEVLAVGDIAFQRKCMDFAQRAHRNDCTILFVSHNMFSIKSMCERSLYLKQGQLHYDGKTDAAIRLYEEDCKLSDVRWARRDSADWPIRITHAEIQDHRGAAKTVFDYGDRLSLQIQVNASIVAEDPNFIVVIERSDGVACCNFSTETDGVATGRISGQLEIRLLTPPLRLVAESYNVSVLVRKKGFQDLLGAQVVGTFHVRHDLFDKNFGVFHEPGQWKLECDRSNCYQRPGELRTTQETEDR